MPVREAKNAFGLMLDTARGAVMVVSVEASERPFAQSGRACEGKRG